MSRCSSASVWGGIGCPSGVRNVARRLRSAAQFGVEAADAEAGRGGFQPVDDASALADQVLTLPGRTLGVLLFEGWDRGHAAMIRLAAQPADEGTLEQA